MPPRPSRVTPSPKGPSHDPATYRDVLLFEERLKSTAASLQRRKSRYQVFLANLLLVIAFLLLEVFLPSESSLLVVPYKLLLIRLLPDLYDVDTVVIIHPYITTGLLFVSVTTLFLFFASGMYSEKIAYANKYVPHANRSLRSFNMYLNVRKPPLRSKFYLNPLPLLFPRTEEFQDNGRLRKSRSPSPNVRTAFSRSASIPISPIPPASTPRGELIFSSRVDRHFRESYERYRAAFERRREEKAWEHRKQVWWGKLFFWQKPPTTPAPYIRTSPTLSRGRTARTSPTPTMHQRDDDMPSSLTSTSPPRGRLKVLRTEE